MPKGIYKRDPDKLAIDYLHRYIDSKGTYDKRIKAIKFIEHHLSMKHLSIITMSMIDSTLDLQKSPLLKLLDKKVRKFHWQAGKKI